MAEPILVKLGAGALQQAPATLVVSWQTADGALGEGTLSQLLLARGRQSLGIILSSADVQLTSVSLSRRQARHLQKVLPYLLEEQVLGDPEELWFAPGAAAEGRYSVVICDRASLERLKTWLEEQGAVLQGAAVDGQMLATDQAPLLVEDRENTLVIASEGSVLALPPDQVEATCAALALEIHDWPRLRGPEQIFAALRTHWRERVELLQGALRPQQQERGGLRLLPVAWRPLAGFAAAVLALAWLLVWAQAWRYHQLAESQRRQAAVLYEELFPGDRATSKLFAQFRSRMAQLGGASGGDSGFFRLMAPVGSSLASAREQGVKPRRISFDDREGALLLDLEARNYEGLEAVREKVRAAGLEAEIANFRDQGETVAARMKVGAG